VALDASPLGICVARQVRMKRLEDLESIMRMKLAKGEVALREKSDLK
jgi:hypothetical protein